MSGSTSDLQASVAALLAELAALGSEQVRTRNLRQGAGENQFGVKMGDIRKVATRLKTDHRLGLALWDTNNLEARLLAVLIIEPKLLSGAQLDSLVRSATFAQLADWLNSYVVKNHPDAQSLRVAWLKSTDPWAARAGWNLTAGLIARHPDSLDLPGLLDRIETEMPTAHPAAQWTMNNCLAGIGIHHPALRQRALTIGERLGVYRDYPVHKGCISPFAPIWIEAMVARQG